jgi:uncharacterized delta-60 repeat protein
MIIIGVRVCTVVSFLLYVTAVCGAAGKVDPSFNAETGVSGWVRVVTALPDGKVLLGGEFTMVQGAPRAGIARLNADGALDETFNPSDLRNRFVLTQVIQPDGKIVLGGGGDGTRGWVMRLNPDGTIDSSFKPPLEFGQTVTKLVLQSDGKILVGGLFEVNGGAPGNMVARLNSDGSVDGSFSVGEMPYSGVSGMSLQADGKLVVSFGFAPVRLNADGSIDTSFTAPALDYSQVTSLATQSDGKVVIGGLLRFAGTTKLFNLLRLNSDGSTDNNFVRPTRGYFDVPAIVVDKDNSVLISGSHYGISEVLRLFSNGVVNTNFVAPRGAATEISSISVDQSSNVIVAGAFAWPRGIANVARLRASGALDSTFRPGFSLTGVFIPNVAVDTNNNAIAALTASDQGGTTVQRFNVDGSLDTNFAMTVLRGYPTLLLQQQDGKILFGSQYPLGDKLAPDFKRLNTDGTADSSFKVPYVKDVIRAAVQQPDGKIVIAGAFKTLNGMAADRVGRLNSDGTVDRTFESLLFFGSPAIEDDVARALAIQPDGKILVGIEFHACGCERGKVQAVIRLNADGSYDSAFDSSEIAPSWVNRLVVLPDGKILVGGFQFSQSDLTKTPRHGMVRLDANGSLDETFNTALPPGSDVRAIAIDSNGKIVINNTFSVMRLNGDGSADPTFTTAIAGNGDQYSMDMGLAPDGNIYFSDSFDTVNGVRRPRLARLFGTPVPIALKAASGAEGAVLTWTNPQMQLESAAAVEGPYSKVGGAKSPWNIGGSAAGVFFRLSAQP